MQVFVVDMNVGFTESRIIPAIKLSDDPGKACGDSKAIEHARYELGLEDG